MPRSASAAGSCAKLACTISKRGSAIASGPVLGRRDGDRVAVDADHARARAQARQQLARVAAAAEGAVDIDAVRVRHERVDRFVEQDGGVQPRVFHDAQKMRLSRAAPACACISAASLAA